MIRVQEITVGKSGICDAVLHALPRWFGIESAIIDFTLDVASMPTFTAEVGGRVAGFVSLNSHNDYTAEIHVIGVLEEFHRKGVGRALVDAAAGHARGRGHEFLSVKTLSPSRPDENYDKTRAFYLSQGFKPVEEFKTLWGKDNPCLLLIKAL